MKILITRFSWQTKSLGGAEASAEIFATVLSKLGHKVILATNFDNRRGAQHLKIPLPKHRWLQQIVGFFILPFLLVYDFDLINPQSRSDQVVFSLLKPLHKKPVVWRDAGDLVHQIKKTRKNPLALFNQLLLIKAIVQADAITMLNDSEKHTFLSLLSDHVSSKDLGSISKKIYIVPSDILQSDYSQNKRSTFATSNKIVVGFLGRLEERKGLTVLLEAIKHFDVHTLSKIKILVAGEGELKQQLERKSRKLPVVFIGYQDDVSSFFSSIDIFVQPALFEGWGRTVKEAMYFGKPVVGSNTGGIAKQIEDGKTGLLFEPGNAKELAEKLQTLIDNKTLRSRLGKAARKKALADGDYNKTIKEKVVPIFLRAIKENSR